MLISAISNKKLLKLTVLGLEFGDKKFIFDLINCIWRLFIAIFERESALLTHFESPNL